LQKGENESFEKKMFVDEIQEFLGDDNEDNEDDDSDSCLESEEDEHSHSSHSEGPSDEVSFDSVHGLSLLF